jgi:hypothetical protein
MQLAAAQELAQPLTELPFPNVPPEGDTTALVALALQTLAAIPEGVTHAMVMGEMTLTHYLVNQLQQRGVTCVAATTRRVAHTDGGVKQSRYGFIRFRTYMP